MTMYLAIDIGGTKTLLAVFSANGDLVESFKFPTPKKYADFKQELKKAVKVELAHHKFIMACVAVPALLNHESGVAIAFGNLDWKHIPIKYDLQQALDQPVIIENDAKLAGLSEANLVIKDYKKVLYITISTGIGGGFVVNGKLDPNMIDTEPGQMAIEHEGKVVKWESFASGKAIVKRFGKRASDIDDQKTWQIISADIANGLINVIALTQPDVVIIGGGVGTHFDKFDTALKHELDKFKNPLVPIPPILGAQRPEEAVIYGCYELIRQSK